MFEIYKHDGLTNLLMGQTPDEDRAKVMAVHWSRSTPHDIHVRRVGETYPLWVYRQGTLQAPSGIDALLEAERADEKI